MPVFTIISTLRMWTALLCVVVLAHGTLADDSSGWRLWPGSRLVESTHNDGDSFRVATPDGTFVIRLYGVDCPETATGSESDLRRIREQTRYFGLEDALTTLHFGREASAATARLLAAPFTVHTTMAAAPGRSAAGRVYAFVTTADGRDLGEELVRRGLARAFGVMRGGPDDTPRDERLARLADLEHAAMLDRVGIWAAADAERLISARGDERRDKREVESIRSELIARAMPIDINMAAPYELQLLPGIGPVLAARIIEHRPFAHIDALLDVPGIGSAIFERIRDLLRSGDYPPAIAD